MSHNNRFYSTCVIKFAYHTTVKCFNALVRYSGYYDTTDIIYRFYEN